MKKSLTLLFLIALTGCGTLIPKNVEFFQKKVKSVPVASESAKETERQAAALASVKAEETFVAAVEANSPATVLAPAKDTELLTRAVSGSLGPPAYTYAGITTNLVNKVDSNVAKLNRKVGNYSEKVAPLVGKKIEGTGFFRMGYFTYIGIIIGLVVLAWFALKIYGSINPIVGLGTNVVGRLGSKSVAGIASELVKGGEVFKEDVLHSTLAHDVKAEVLRLFSGAHAKAQSTDTKSVVSALTVKPSQA